MLWKRNGSPIVCLWSTFRIQCCKEINKLNSTVGRFVKAIHTHIQYVPQGENLRCRNRENKRNQPLLLSCNLIHDVRMHTMKPWNWSMCISINSDKLVSRRLSRRCCVSFSPISQLQFAIRAFLIYILFSLARIHSQFVTSSQSKSDASMPISLNYF